MIQGIVFGLLTGFMLAGVAAAVYYISVRLLSPGNSGSYAVLLIADKTGENLAQMIYAAYLRLDLLGDSACARVIAVDMGMSDAERESCENLCRECGGVYLCKPDEIVGLLADECNNVADEE